MSTNKKKVLIVSFRSGFGHLRSAQALEDYAQEHLPAVSVSQQDVAELDPVFGMHADSYEIMTKRFPLLWALLYKQAAVSSLLKLEAVVLGTINKKIQEMVMAADPDIIIFTNIIISPLFVGALKSLKRRPLVGAVITDYHAHAYYNLPFIDYYFMPNQAVADDFQKLGVPAAKIAVTGIPINPKFYVVESSAALKKKYGVSSELPVVLLITSFRISPDECQMLVQKVLALNPQVTLFMIANGNKVLYETIKRRFSGERRLLLVDWTNEIEEYIAMADVVVTKAGGLTTTECLTLQKKMIVFRPIPGQEEYNAAFIEAHEFGVRVFSIDELVSKIPIIMQSSGGQNTVAIPQGNPSKKILETLLAQAS